MNKTLLTSLPIFASVLLAGACTTDIDALIEESQQPQPVPMPATPATAAQDPFCPGLGIDFQTDSNHCGACNHSCLGGACAAGICQPMLLASETVYERIEWVRAAANRVYYLACSNGGSCAIKSVAKNGSQQLQHFTTTAGIDSIEVDGSHVYFAQQGEIYRLAKSAGSVPSLVVSVPGFSFGGGSPGFRVDGSHVYHQGTDATGTTVVLARTPKTGGPTQTVFAVPADGLSYVAAFDLDASSAFVSVFHAGEPVTMTVHRVSKVGLQAQELGTVHEYAGEIVATRNHACLSMTDATFPDPSDPYHWGNLYCLPKDGGPILVRKGITSTLPSRLEADSDNVYFMDFVDTSASRFALSRTSVGTGAHTIFPAPPGSSTGISLAVALDARAAFYGGFGGGKNALYKIAK